jgi:Protein of unknown function (DUF2971)
MNVKEILRRQPPDLLYHYTTQNGLLGVVTSREIWASHTQYLNDSREFRHALEVVREELAIMKLEDSSADRSVLIDEMEEALTMSVETVNVCVCSFSADGDTLSQWRAYGGAASGFSIGFSGAFLRAVSDQLGFWLVPVLYGEGENRELVRSLITLVLDENSARPLPQMESSDRVGQPLGGNLVAYLNRYAPILKHNSFAGEQEWRIISRPIYCSRDGFGYRPGASTLIPYFRIPLCTEQQAFSVEEIVVGPTPHPHLSVRSVKSLLTRHDLEKTNVYSSETPYRNW